MKTHAQKKREYRGYHERLHAARLLLQHAKDGLKGGHYLLTTSLAFSAFAIEAYCNHAGKLIFHDDWNERRSPRTKLRLILKTLNLPADFSQGDLQRVTELFLFRNWLAHGKTEKIGPTNFRGSLDDDEFYRDLPHRQERIVTVQHAARMVSIVESLICRINAALPKPDIAPLAAGLSEGSATYSA